eukprot:c27162_g1_i2 orf=472-1056(+)
MVTVEDFQLPEELLAVLPTDPFEQLDVARKISCMAMAARVSKLEAETGKLRQKLTEKENTIFNLQQHVRELEQLMEENKARLSNALEEQTKLTNEKNVLLATVKKLNRDVVKLETFKRTLMQSLQEDEEQREDGERITRHSSLNSSLSSINPSKGLLSQNFPLCNQLQILPEYLKLKNNMLMLMRSLGTGSHFR